MEHAVMSGGAGDPAANESDRELDAEHAEYVNDARYAELYALWHEIRRADAPAAAASAETLSLVFKEARLLDDRHYDEWLSMFAPQCLYWIPNRFEPGDPRMESGVYLDDLRRMADRIALIRTGHLHAQTPRSRTRRVLSNVEQFRAENGALLVRANLVIWEYRKGITRAYAGWQGYEIQSGLVASKIIALLDCDAPQGNYSFML